jgi:hypothetical protein
LWFAVSSLLRATRSVFSEWYFGTATDGFTPTQTKSGVSNKLSKLSIHQARQKWNDRWRSFWRMHRDILANGVTELGAWGAFDVRPLVVSLGRAEGHTRTLCKNAWDRIRSSYVAQAVINSRWGLTWRISRQARRLGEDDSRSSFLGLEAFPVPALAAWHRLLQEMTALDPPEQRALDPLIVATLNTLQQAACVTGGPVRYRRKFFKEKRGIRAEILADPIRLNQLLDIARSHPKTFRVIDAWVNAAITVPESALIGFRLPRPDDLRWIQEEVRASETRDQKEKQVKALLECWRSEIRKDASPVGPDCSSAVRSTAASDEVSDHSTGYGLAAPPCWIPIVPPMSSFVFGPFPVDGVEPEAVPVPGQESGPDSPERGVPSPSAHPGDLLVSVASGSSPNDPLSRSSVSTRSDPAGGAVNAPILCWHAQAPDQPPNRYSDRS